MLLVDHAAIQRVVCLNNQAASDHCLYVFRQWDGVHGRER